MIGFLRCRLFLSVALLVVAIGSANAAKPERIEIAKKEHRYTYAEIRQEEWAFNTKAGWKDEDDKLADCLVEEGIGPDHSLKFEVSADIIAAAKVRFETRDELFVAKAAG